MHKYVFQCVLISQMMEAGETLVTRMLSMENEMLQKMIIGYRDQMISMKVGMHMQHHLEICIYIYIYIY